MYRRRAVTGFPVPLDFSRAHTLIIINLYAHFSPHRVFQQRIRAFRSPLLPVIIIGGRLYVDSLPINMHRYRRTRIAGRADRYAIVRA